MTKNKPEKTPPLLPERVVEIGWGLTLAYSESADPNTTTTVEKYRNQIKQIRNDLDQQITNLETLKQSNPTPDIISELEAKNKDLKYIDNINALLSASERNLHTIVKGRDQNFKQTDSLMKTQIENIESSQRLTTNLHSAIPRLFATGAGASGTVLVNYITQSAFNYTIPVEVLAAAATIVAGAFYGFYQWQIAPKNVKRTQEELIKNDYRRGIYFQQYIDRAVSTLTTLFEQTLNTYELIYEEPYRNNKYNDEEEKRKVIWGVLGGKEGICGKKCQRVYKHYAENKIKPELWASCETSEGSEQCPYFRN